MYLKIFVFLLFVQVCAQDDLKTISWNENRPLLWADFEDQPAENSDAAALTASGITFGFSINKENGRAVDFSTTVKCLFYPEKSWAKPNLADDYILKHEQLHFDITELHARKFRKAITELQISSRLKNQLNTLYKPINKASFEMQKRYDEETNHSIDRDLQAKWNSFIASELKKYEPYKSK